MNHRDA
ncbi:hypothetical protein D030_3953A, partial [Vibrio parahaemolyticus AQ3810]